MKTNLTYRNHKVVIYFNRNSFNWEVSGDLSATLNAVSDDQALIEVKAMINRQSL